jgi:superfamily I DNA/RNA helicase
LGYVVSIPEGIREGVPVQKLLCQSIAEEIQEIEKIVKRKDRGSIGILAKDTEYLLEIKDYFREEKDVFVLSMSEAQGVEFDIVCLVGLDEDTFVVHYGENTELQEEKQKIYKDLLYVALTRAMSELFVFGKISLKI